MARDTAVAPLNPGRGVASTIHASCPSTAASPARRRSNPSSNSFRGSRRRSAPPLVPPLIRIGDALLALLLGFLGAFLVAPAELLLFLALLVGRQGLVV